MATIDAKSSQTIPEPTDFVGKMVSDRRKTKKPLMEKLRRDRINSSLNEMKLLVLESLNKDVSRYSKMEKADILEMTVKFLRDINRQERTKRGPMSWAEYRAGYNQCAIELMRHATPISPGDMQMHGKVFAHVPAGFHGNTHVSTQPPTFILPNPSTALPTSPVNITTPKIPTVVWVPIPSPPPSPSNKTSTSTPSTITTKKEIVHEKVQSVHDTLAETKNLVNIKATASNRQLIPNPPMWRPW